MSRHNDTAVPFKPDRFRSAAAHYLAGRPGYSPRLIAHVVGQCRFDEESRLMDLGCGPGQLAAAFAPFVGSVMAVDPDEEMLEVALATNAEHSNVGIVRGTSADLGPEFGHFAAVTMGRSFHWMDRVDTLCRLDGLVDRGGAVILFDTDSIKVPDNEWQDGYRKILEAYRTEPPPHQEPGWIPHEAVLLDSPFSVLESIGVIERRRIDPQTLVDRALSLSTTTKASLGKKADKLRKEVAAFAESVAVDGKITEVVKSQALIATRPSG